MRDTSPKSIRIVCLLQWKKNQRYCPALLTDRKIFFAVFNDTTRNGIIKENMAIFWIKLNTIVLNPFFLYVRNGN